MAVRKSSILVGFVVLLLALAMQSFYTVHQTQTALLLQLGKPLGEPREPGLHFKLPFIQNVIYFDTRILDYDAKPAEILTSDKKTLVVDNYSKWRIVDPLSFYQTVRTIPGAQARLEDVIFSQMRESLGRHSLTEVVSSKRQQIMEQVTAQSSKIIDEYGIKVLDVRIRRTDLPAENERAVFERMRAERERQAKQYRSEGNEESAKIRSTAERQRAVILAEANRKAEVIRGEGDGEATRVYAEALNQDPDFYSFKRSLDAYQRSFANNTQILLTPENEFLKHLD